MNNTFSRKATETYVNNIINIVDDFQDIPSILYHYTNLDALLKIITNKGLEFWFSKIDYLNDSTEFIYTKKICEEIFSEEHVYQLLDSVIKKYNKNTGLTINTQKETNYIRSLLYNLWDFSVEKFSFFVLSMSSIKNSLNLWSNFSPIDGCNIGINVSSVLKEINELHYGKVIYNKKNQIKLLESHLENLVKKYIIFLIKKNENLIDENDYEFADCLTQFLVDSIFFKDEYFSIENEYRLIILDDFKSPNIQFRHKQGTIIPYYEILFNEKQVLREINLSPKNNSDNVLTGLKQFLINKGYDENISIEKPLIFLRY